MGKNLDIFGKALRDHYLNQGNEMLMYRTLSGKRINNTV